MLYKVSQYGLDSEDRLSRQVASMPQGCPKCRFIHETAQIDQGEESRVCGCETDSLIGVLYYLLHGYPGPGEETCQSQNILIGGSIVTRWPSR